MKMNSVVWMAAVGGIAAVIGQVALAANVKVTPLGGHDSEMPPFFEGKLKANGGNPADSILARFGGSVRQGGVRISTVPAIHSNGLDPDYIGGELGKNMKDAGIAGYVGEATGYVLTFSNSLGTKGGKVIPGNKTDTFMNAVKVPVHIPLSGKTMEFDDNGKCVAGC